MSKDNTQDESFGARLAKIRKKTGYSQRALAKETGLSQRMIAYYESQGGRIPADLVVKLADALGVSTDALLKDNNGTDEKPRNKQLLKKLLQLERIPSRDRESVLRIIDGLVSKYKLQELQEKNNGVSLP